MKNRSVLEDRDRELQRLTDLLKQRDAEIRAMKDADNQRVAVLQSAVQAYCSRSPFNPWVAAAAAAGNSSADVANIIISVV